MARKHHMYITIYTKIYTFKPSMHTYECTKHYEQLYMYYTYVA